MGIILFYLFFNDIEKRISTRQVEIPPVIDGVIEEIWNQADSAFNFIQYKPDEGKPATQKTVVYILRDRENFYVAFRCYDTEPDHLALFLKPRDEATGDMVSLYLDTFQDRCSAYRFDVSARGVMSDYYISQDGLSSDIAWDGVWYCATKVFSWGYSVEMKIPFRTLKYRKASSEWGINFGRYIYRRKEWAYWSPQKLGEGVKVSCSGILTELRPEVTGQQIELFPVGIIHYKKSIKSEIRPDGGVDLSWIPGRASKLQLTTNPDFAQIEADPYQFNLTKYEPYLTERRPFFIEAQDLFAPPRSPVSIGEPIKIYYSRRIGRPLPDGQVVPILAGLRYNTRFERFQTGVMGVVCKERVYEFKGDSLVEPESYFFTGRLKRGFFKNSDLGILYTGKENKDYFSRASVIDGTVRTSDISFSFQAAGVKVKDQPVGLAGKSDIGYVKRNFFCGAGYKVIEDEFDVSDIGFQTWKGLQYGVTGGLSAFSFDLIRSAAIGLSAGRSREAGEIYTGNYYGGWGQLVFNSGLGSYLSIQQNIDYEMGLIYQTLNYRAICWFDGSKYFDLYGVFGWSTIFYNYQRGYFGSGGGVDMGLDIRPLSNLGIGFDMDDYIECDSAGYIIADNIIWYIKIHHSLTRDFNIRIYAQPNFITDLHNINLLLSYNFLPKSWIYLALNEIREKNSLDFKERAAVLKVKYLIYF